MIKLVNMGDMYDKYIANLIDHQVYWGTHGLYVSISMPIIIINKMLLLLI